jgi:hypothetical protein
VVGALIRPWDTKILKPGRRQKKKRQCRLHLKVGIWPGAGKQAVATMGWAHGALCECSWVPASLSQHAGQPQPQRGSCARAVSWMLWCCAADFYA